MALELEGTPLRIMDCEIRSLMALVCLAMLPLLVQYLDLEITLSPMVKVSRTHHCGSLHTNWNYLDQNGRPAWPTDNIHLGN